MQTVLFRIWTRIAMSTLIFLNTPMYKMWVGESNTSVYKGESVSQ